VVPATHVFVMVSVAVSPYPIDALDALSVKVSSITVVAAFEDEVFITPNPRATTSASAMRLKLVLLDISFLSSVVFETFPNTAGEEFLFAL